MSLTASRLATAGGLTLALALATPGTALAHHADGHAGGPPSPSPEQPPAEERQEPAPQGGGSGSESGSGSDSGDRTTGGEAEPARPADTDPAGNNGTVKIDGAPFDDGRGNDPHVGCEFEIDFYGFDDGQTAQVTLTGQAPTGSGTQLYSASHGISDDAAGGGQDADAEIRLSVATHLPALDGIEPHPQQGWHVKLTVDVDDAPGGAKQKVFWISCPEQAAVDSAGTGVESATAQDSDAVDLGAAGTPVLPARTGVVEGLEEDVVVAAAAQDAAVLGSSLGRSLGRGTGAEASDAEQVSARTSVLPSVLPFTGTQALVGLLVTGLAALAAGGAALRAGRRRST